MRAKVQKALAWTGPAMIVLWVGSFIVLARWIPPPSPRDPAGEVLSRFADHTFGIQLGMELTMYASALLIPFCAVIYAQMRRIEGPGGPLAMTQMCSAAVLSLEFIVPARRRERAAVWMVAMFVLVRRAIDQEALEASAEQALRDAAVVA